MEQKCRYCEKTSEQIALNKCQICFKHYCDEHAVKTSGVSFCSAGCGHYFFHVDPDQEG